MSKLNIYNLPIRAHGISSKGNYERKFSSLTRKFAELGTEQCCVPYCHLAVARSSAIG